MHWFLVVLSVLNIVIFGSCYFFSTQETKKNDALDHVIDIAFVILVIANICVILNRFEWLVGEKWPSVTYLISSVIIGLMVLLAFDHEHKDRFEKILTLFLAIVAIGNVIGSIFG